MLTKQLHEHFSYEVLIRIVTCYNFKFSRKKYDVQIKHGSKTANFPCLRIPNVGEIFYFFGEKTHRLIFNY